MGDQRLLQFSKENYESRNAFMEIEAERLQKICPLEESEHPMRLEILSDGFRQQAFQLLLGGP